MALPRRNNLIFAVALPAICSSATLVWGQDPPAPQGTENSAASANEAARRQIVESDRWREMRRNFDQWLAVQQIYTMDEVAAMRAELNDRASRMSAEELG